MGFNRNILGCKGISSKRRLIGITDLIETYWDVKFLGLAYGFGGLQDLIETYWDVKEHPSIPHLLVYRFNRNILGCKAKSAL